MFLSSYTNLKFKSCWSRPTSSILNLIPSWSYLMNTSKAGSQTMNITHLNFAYCVLLASGDLFLILYYTCFHGILPNHPTLSLSRRVQKTVLYIIPTPVRVFSFRTESINQTSLDFYLAVQIHTILVHTFKLCEKFSNSDISAKNLNFISLCWFKNSVGSKIWWNLKLAP